MGIANKKVILKVHLLPEHKQRISLARKLVESQEITSGLILKWREDYSAIILGAQIFLRKLQNGRKCKLLRNEFPTQQFKKLGLYRILPHANDF